jgi:hypothetical protein
MRESSSSTFHEESIYTKDFRVFYVDGMVQCKDASTGEEGD